MFDLHTHSILSDGHLLPSEVARRYEEKGYKIIAITDHVDRSNIEFVCSSILEFTNSFRNNKIKVLPGVELSHIPPDQFLPLAEYARSRGIKIIIGHGETIVEPVIPGTNRAAIQADVDILAHPGLISKEDVKLAVKKGTFLEITSRRGHSLTNGHIAKLALKYKAKISIDSDSHGPEDILNPEDKLKIAQGSGLSLEQIALAYKNLENFLKNK
ncbi:MAG: histidinol phosphate phosphatase domain-containing protein [Candidatus Omnitrophota bacterium]